MNTQNSARVPESPYSTAKLLYSQEIIKGHRISGSYLEGSHIYRIVHRSSLLSHLMCAIRYSVCKPFTCDLCCRCSISHSCEPGQEQCLLRAWVLPESSFYYWWYLYCGLFADKSPGIATAHKADGEITSHFRALRPNGLSVDAAGLVVSLNRDLASDLISLPPFPLCSLPYPCDHGPF